MDLLSQAGAWLEQQRAAYLATAVTYFRRSQSIAGLRATIGRTEFEVDNGYEVLERIESRDFLVLSSDLALNSEAILPQQGDTIVEGGKTYEVNAPGKEPCWRYSDLYRNTIRIHTKLITHT